MKQDQFPISLKIFMVLGVVASVVIIGYILVTIFFMSMHYKALKGFDGGPEINYAELGQEGILCGGPELFPCLPGFVCSNGADRLEAAYGICVPDDRVMPDAAGLGEACFDEKPCAPGLRCEKAENASTGVCEAIQIPGEPLENGS